MKRVISRIILFLFFYLPASVSFCQDSLIYFFDKDYKSSDAEKAVYVGIGVKEKGKIRFTNYNNKNSLVVFKGWFSDSTLSVRDGLFTFYDSTGLEANEGLYRNGKEEGYWITWRSGNVDSILYQN